MDLTGLKNQNNNLEDIASKKEEEKKKLTERCQEFLEQNSKLNKQVIGQMALQGCWHMIWDKIISEFDKFRPCLNFIADQEDALEVAKKNVLKVKGELHKRFVGTTKNAINFQKNRLVGMISQTDLLSFLDPKRW